MLARQLIRELGKEHTILLSTHILPEVEMTCDRVIIIHRGRVAVSGSLRELEQQSGEQIVVETAEPIENLAPVRDLDGVAKVEYNPTAHGGRLRVTGDGTEEIAPRLCALAVVQQWKVRELRPQRQNLEELFVRITEKEEKIED